MAASATAPPAGQTAAADFEAALAREMLHNERLRFTILSVAFAGLLAAFGVMVLVARAEVNRLFAGRLDLGASAVFLGAFVLYVTLARWRMGHFIRQGQPLPGFVRYANAFVEMSLPTLVLALMYRWGFSAAEALLAPPMLFYFLFLALSTLRLDWKICVFSGVVAGVEYVALARWLLWQGPPEPGLLGAIAYYATRGLILAGAGGLAGIVAVQLRRQFMNTLTSVRRAEQVLDVFGQHVSPAVVQQLLTQRVGLGGETRQVCVLFLDVRGFTTYAEQHAPAEVVTYLNQLFAFMVACINEEHGLVNKFLGDGFMAVFGAPLADDQAPLHAVRAARAIVARLHAETSAGRIPATRVGIGLHYGEAVTGTVGSAQRQEYTLVGDTVNVAARIEQLNKQFESQILASRAVWDALPPAAQHGTALGPLQVKGHAQPVEIYQLG